MHTLRLKLNVDDNTAAVLEKRFRILAHISNQIRKKVKMMLSRLEDDKQYQQALDEYIKLKKLNSDDKQVQNDMKRLLKFMNDTREGIGLTKSGLEKYASVMQHQYKKNISSHQVQAEAAHVYKGVETVLFGSGKDVHYKKESDFRTIPNNRPYGDLHINMTTIPDNLVKALVYYGSLKTLRCIYVHIDNANGVYDFVLPDSITSIRNGYSKIALDFNMLANTEYIHNTKRLETAFHYAASSRYECIVAYKTYLKTKHKAAKEFLEKEQYRVAAAIIEELDEKDFVDFVKLRCINLEYDSCIMKRLQEKNWNIALAYMLEEGNGKTKDTLVI